MIYFEFSKSLALIRYMCIYSPLYVILFQVDSFSLFYNVQPERGSEHAASSYITLLAVAWTLGALNTTIKQEMADIMFVFFQGVRKNIQIMCHVYMYMYRSCRVLPGFFRSVGDFCRLRVCEATAWGLGPT